MRRVYMLNLQGEYKLFADEVREAVCGVLESGRYIGGAEVSQLEVALSTRFGVGHEREASPRENRPAVCYTSPRFLDDAV